MLVIQIKEEFVGCKKWHRAIELGGAEAIQMWLAMKRYAAEHLTDGFVADSDIDTLPGAPRRPRRKLKALVDCGVTNRDGSRGPGLLSATESGWQLLDEAPRAAATQYRFSSTEKRLSGVLCSYCGNELVVGYTHGPDGFTWDHVVPRCQGGSDEPSNLVPACRSCNSRKCGRTPEQAGMVLQ